MNQLYSDYELILWEHRVKMRSVAIQLFDSKSHWGQWNPLTRTISIARRLVTDYSWVYVLEILRHEMAHQMADEIYNAGQCGDTSHGHFFQLSCQRLGVRTEFAHASAQLQDGPLDWRETDPDEPTKKLLEKVQKLLALATSSNEHEALLAMTKARELHAKYQLEAKSVGESAKNTEYYHISITHGKKRFEAHERRLHSILVEHFFVRVISSPLFDARSGQEFKRFEIIGTRENVLMAEYVYQFLLQQSEYWVQESVKSSKTKIDRVQRKSFRLGLLSGFSDKLRQSEYVGPQLNEVGQALVKFKKDKNLENYIALSFPRLSTTSNSGQYIDDHAFNAGQTIGKSLTLNKPVAGRSTDSGRLLECK